MELYYIRHGQSVNNAHWKEPGYREHPDAPLTEAGVEQARLLSEHVRAKDALEGDSRDDNLNRRGYRFSRLYTSLVARAVATSAPLARATGTPWAAWKEIHEVGGIFGRDETETLVELPGHPRSFFERNYPELALPAALGEAGWWNRPFETDEERQPRADRFFRELLERHGDREGREPERVAIVSHGGFFNHLMRAMLELPWRQGAPGREAWFILNNCSISRFDIRKDGIMIQYLNRVDYLPDDLVTG